MAHVEFTVTDQVARVEVQRPDAMNAIDLETKSVIIDQLRQYDEEGDVRVVVFQSTGDAFCAGGDIGDIPEVDFRLEPFTESWGELFDVMESMAAPTVARIDGLTLGGGFDLLLHTDIPVAAADARLGQPETGLGIVNHFSPPRLERAVGSKKTLDLMLTGRLISGREASDLGLVARSVPAEDLDDEVDDVVDSLLANSPRVLRKVKQGIHTTSDMSPGAAEAHLETVALESARRDPDYREGIEAQLEDREPEWQE